MCVCDSRDQEKWGEKKNCSGAVAFVRPALLFHLLIRSFILQVFIEPLARGIVYCAKNVILNCVHIPGQVN